MAWGLLFRAAMKRDVLGVLPLGVLLLALWLGGCTPPLTPYRNVGMVPAATMPQWDGRAADRGHVRLEGSGYYAGTIENPAPDIHDSALRVPDVSMSGSAAVAVVNGLELGVRVSYANYRWASTTASGTPPIPSKPSMIGGGPELRSSIPLDSRKRFTLGGYAGVQMVSLPYARWELKTQAGQGPRTFDTSFYTLRDEDSKTMLNGQIAFMPTFTFDPRYGHLFLAIGAHSAFKNDGFATQSNANAVGGDGLVAIFGMGYGFQIDVFRASFAWYAPLSRADNARYLFGGMLTLGVDLNAFGAVERREQDSHDPEPATPQEPVQTTESGPASF